VNYGTATVLRVDSGGAETTYVRFVVQGITGTVTKATLKMYANSIQSVGYDVHHVADNSWLEGTINYSNAPTYDAGIIGSSGPFVANQWTSVDVTSQVTGNGTYSFALTSSNVTAISLASRETVTTAPQLDIAVQ
jgi:hypothetical protein